MKRKRTPKAPKPTPERNTAARTTREPEQCAGHQRPHQPDEAPLERKPTTMLERHGTHSRPYRFQPLRSTRRRRSCFVVQGFLSKRRSGPTLLHCFHRSGETSLRGHSCAQFQSIFHFIQTASILRQTWPPPALATWKTCDRMLATTMWCFTHMQTTMLLSDGPAQLPCLGKSFQRRSRQQLDMCTAHCCNRLPA